MSKSGYQSTNSRSQYLTHTIKTSSNILSSHQEKQKNLNELDIDSDFYEDFNPSQSSNIFRQSTDRSYDEKGKYNTRKNHTIKVSKDIKKENKRVSKYSNIKNEAERQKALYSSPDFRSGSPYESPLFINDKKYPKDVEEMGYKTNFVYESKKINGKNIGTYSTSEKYEYITKNGKKESKYEKSSLGSPSGIDIISPVGYIENNSSGSDNDENQIKSFENYQYSLNTNNINKSNYTKTHQFKKNEKNKYKLNYELEEPEGFDYLSKNRKISNDEIKKKSFHYTNRSQIRNKVEDSYTLTSEIKDFQSPERKLNESKKFRKVNMGMINSKGPSNNDRKVTNIITKEIIQTTKSKKISKKDENYKYSDDPKIRAEAAKIIQYWWRRKNYREEEIYDITVKSAVKLQSFIRGFLVRKKVLRYITLAIYYQSFCDKLQDVLCNYVKNIIFKLFKDKFLGVTKKKQVQKNKKENIYKRKLLLINIIERNIEKNEYHMSKILQKWRKIAYIMRNKDTKIHKIIKTNYQTKIKTDYDNTLNRSNLTNISYSNNRYLRDLRIKTQQNTSMNNYQNNINKSYQYIMSPSTITSLRPHKIKYNPNTYSNCIIANRRSPYTYSNKIITTEERKSHFSPYKEKKSYENNYQINVNKSYDNYNFKRDIEKLNFTTTDEILNHKYFARVHNSREKERKISPQFGTLRNGQRKPYDNNSIVNVVDRRRTISNIDDNYINRINTTTIDTSSRTQKILRDMDRKIHKINTDLNRNINMNRYINNSISRNEVMPGENISIIKLQKDRNIRRIFSPLSKDEYSDRKKKRSITSRRYKTYTEYDRVNRNNIIDNQLSVSIIKLPDDDDEKLNKTTIEEPQVIKLKEKIIIQKELQPETAEEGVGFQIFDMVISKRVSLFIEPSTELRQKITDEQKELEVFKKREREKNNEIDKYKQDIEKEKINNKHKSLKNAVRTVEYFKKRVLYKKFVQYRKNSSIKSFVLEIDPMDDWQITHKPKEKKDFAVQINQSSPEKKVVRNFKILKITKSFPVSYIYKKPEKPQKITRTKLNIISQSKKKDQGQQSDSWNTEITPLNNSNLNILQSKKNRYASNSIDKTKTLEIIRTRPTMVDEEAQNEHIENRIEGISLEIIKKNKKFRNSSSQYVSEKPKISNQKKFSIISKKKEKKILTRDAQCNTITLKKEEKGINAIEKIEQKPKNVEVKIRTVKRSLTKLEIPVLKKIWLRKAFKTFRENCKRPPYHLIIERELLRMYLLKWRFVNGYGPDRYGNAYDRNGNLLYSIKGQVADLEIQNDEIIEKDDQSTQYVPIENVISTLKQIEFGPSYQKYIKKEMKDQSVGSNIKMDEKIQKRDSININRAKKKVNNKITKNGLFIAKKNKQLKDNQTQSVQVDNQIDKMDEFTVIDDEFSVKKKKLRLKELITQMIYRREINEKLNVSEALRNWLKETIIRRHTEEMEYENLRRREAKIKKNDRFSLIESKEKQEMGTQMIIPKNRIETTLNLNLIKNIKKKNAEASANFPNEFDLEKIKPKNENKIVYESKKKPIVLKANKENDMNIYSEDYIFREEIKKGIHHEMTETAKKRVYEILYKFFMSRGEPLSILRKYFSIWYRKTKYISLIENARIISEFCKSHLNSLFTTKRWRKISEKLLFKERIHIVKSSKEITIRINKIFDLIRTTRINTVFSKRRYLHYIIIAWLAYTRNINNKRSHVKSMYENMISTYMNLADDVFGSNQKHNPSVQDALFEAVDSDKFQTKDIQDVPIAKEYYQKKRNMTKVQNIIYHGDNSDYDKEIEKKYMAYKNILNKTNHKYDYLNKYKYKKYKNYNIYDEKKKGHIKVVKEDNNENDDNKENDDKNNKKNKKNEKNDENSGYSGFKENKREFKVDDFMKKYQKKTRETLNTSKDEIKESESKKSLKSNKSEKKEENTESKGRSTFTIIKEEKEIPEIKENDIGKRTFKLEREIKIETKGINTTFGNKKEEKKEIPEIKERDLGKRTFKIEREIKTETKGINTTFGNKKEEKEIPENRSKDTGKRSYRFEKEIKTETKGMNTTFGNKKEEKEVSENKSKDSGKRSYRFEKEIKTEIKDINSIYGNKKEEEIPEIKGREIGKRTFRYQREEKTETKGITSSLGDRKEQKKEETPEIKQREFGKRAFRYQREEKIEPRDDILTFGKRKELKKEETPEIKGKEIRRTTYRFEKEERSDSKGSKRSESKKSGSKYTNKKEEKEKSESKGKERNTYKTEKEEKSESKGKSNDKDLIYKSKIEKEINKNNNSIFESKSIKIKKDKMGETKNITIIKTVNKEEIIKSNNFDDKLNIAEKIVEKKVEKKERNPSYSERRKLFRKKYESYKKEQE